MSYCGIVILNYNTPIDTINCIESVLKFNTARIKIVVVDNASTDDSVSRISGYVNGLKCEMNFIQQASNELPFVTLVQAPKNLGYACGNNLGIDLLKKDSTIDTILILNSDILFVEDIVPKLKENLKDNGAAIVSPVLYKKDLIDFDYNCARLAPSCFEVFLHFLLCAHEPKFLKKRRLLLKKGHPQKALLPVELPSGSCMLFSKKTCDQLGIFDPNTFLYYEENIIAAQIKESRAGRVFVNTDLKCVHLGATSTRKEPSRRIVEAEVQSARYYVNVYVLRNKVLKALFSAICSFYLAIDSFKRLLKR